MSNEFEDMQHLNDVRSEEASVRRARELLATRFLVDVFIPQVKMNGNISRKQFEELIKHFKNENQEIGNDFEPGHVWGIVYEQVMLNDCLARERPNELPRNAAAIRGAFDILTRLELED